MRHTAVFTFTSPAAREIYRSLSPEMSETGQRSEVRVTLQGEDRFVLSVTADDISSLRAALNMWLRLISVAGEMLGIAEARDEGGRSPRTPCGEGMRPGRGRRRGRKAGGRVPTASLADIVMVVHGPEAFDEGDVTRLRAMVSPRETVVAGVMARTAAEESALPVTFDERPPSRVIREIRGKVFLVNRGKTPESGRIFGEIVASRLPAGDPLVQAECSSGTVYLWNGSDPARDFARLLAGLTGFVLEEMKARMPAGGAERKIRGCIPGEAVLVEGIVIGMATAETVVLRQGPGGIEPVSGLRPKAHGLEKLARLGTVDLPLAWCKSGPLRRVSPRRGGSAPAIGRIAVIDHCGHDLYRSLTPVTCGVLAIGDDTTAVCGHICLHRGIPVFGVVDGDLDGLVVGDFPTGSVIAEVRDGTDDQAGRELAALVQDIPVTWSDWVARALASLKGRCRIIHPPSPGLVESRRGKR
jgi:tRNA threonylcarbamoyladenosine modification (KEOPS) complex  Pcc1 subunit